MRIRTPRTTLFPYTTLFRSCGGVVGETEDRETVWAGVAADAAGVRSSGAGAVAGGPVSDSTDRKSTRLNSSHVERAYAVFCLKKKRRAHEGEARSGKRDEDD